MKDDSKGWRAQSIQRIQSALCDSEATIADLCALYRELLRLTGTGVLRIKGNDLSTLSWQEELRRHHMQALPDQGQEWRLIDLAHPLSSLLPDDFWNALPVDPASRRPWDPVAPDALLLHYSTHDQYTCPTQKAALRAMVTMPAGLCLLVTMPTGSGKSLLFQAGIRFFRDHSIGEQPVAVVIAPTRALVEDHLKTLVKIPGLENSRQLNGEMSQRERNEVKEAMLAGTAPLVLASPEILLG